MTGSHTWVSIAQYRRSPLSHICLANPLKAITALQSSYHIPLSSLSPGQSPMDRGKCSAVTKLNQLGSKIFQLLYLYIKLKPLQIQCGVIWVQK